LGPSAYKTLVLQEMQKVAEEQHVAQSEVKAALPQGSLGLHRFRLCANANQQRNHFQSQGTQLSMVLLDQDAQPIPPQTAQLFVVGSK